MADDPVRGFLGRWSRLKQQAATAPAPADAAPVAVPAAGAATSQTEPEVTLPPVESLDFDSDFSGFLGAKVDEGVKRAALKKLFHTGPFNTMDGLDVYIEDFSVFEPLPASMVAQLAHARETLSPTLPADWFGPVVDAEPSGELLEPELLPDVPPATNTLPETPDEPEHESLRLAHADALPGVPEDLTPADPEESRSRSE
jgi:hypothetical protein